MCLHKKLAALLAIAKLAKAKLAKAKLAKAMIAKAKLAKPKLAKGKACKSKACKTSAYKSKASHNNKLAKHRLGCSLRCHNLKLGLMITCECHTIVAQRGPIRIYDNRVPFTKTSQKGPPQQL